MVGGSNAGVPPRGRDGTASKDHRPRLQEPRDPVRASARLRDRQPIRSREVRVPGASLQFSSSIFPCEASKGVQPADFQQRNNTVCKIERRKSEVCGAGTDISNILGLNVN